VVLWFCDGGSSFDHGESQPGDSNGAGIETRCPFAASARERRRPADGRTGLGVKIKSKNSRHAHDANGGKFYENFRAVGVPRCRGSALYRTGASGQTPITKC
jgi:hypothetical protein